MADVKTNTIIIRDETSNNKKVLTTKDVGQDGKITKKTYKKLKQVSSKAPAVEPNRKWRVVNSTANKFTGGLWEKGKRFGSASYGAINASTVGWTILGQFAVNFAYKVFQSEYKKANEENEKNVLRMRTGNMVLPSNYSISTNFSGKISYKTNR